MCQAWALLPSSERFERYPTAMRDLHVSSCVDSCACRVAQQLVHGLSAWRRQAMKRLSCCPTCTSCMLGISRDELERRGFMLRGCSCCKRRVVCVTTDGWCAGRGGPAGAAGGELHAVQRAADHRLQCLGRATCGGRPSGRHHDRAPGGKALLSVVHHVVPSGSISFIALCCSMQGCRRYR